MSFAATIASLRQLRDIEIDLSEPVTLIAGVNGSGKTTVLRALSSLLGWPVAFAMTGVRASFESARGVFVPANRPGYALAGSDVEQIPISWLGAARLLDKYQEAERVRTAPSPGYASASNVQLKGGIVAAALFGFASGAGVVADERAKNVFESYQAALRKTLPSALQFYGLEVKGGEVDIVTETGRFPLDGASGGTAAVLDLVWQLVLASQADSLTPFLVLIDEMENHLHPELQRSLLPGLVEAFPNGRFVVATHSAQVFASVEDAVHLVLVPANEPGTYTAKRVELPASLLTPDEVLRDALGLDVTMPIWVERKLDAIVARHGGDLTIEENYQALRGALTEAGLERLLPTAAGRILANE